MGEPLLIIVIFVSLSMLLPLAFPCTPTNCYIKQGDSKPYCPEGTSSNIRYISLGAVDKASENRQCILYWQPAATDWCRRLAG